jgi:hypothetical protein
MRRSLFSFLPVLLAAPVFAICVRAASIPTAAGTTSLHGEYLEARTADVYTGPCFASSEVSQTGDLAVMGWKIEQGTYHGVALDGLAVMGVLRASNTLGDVTSSAYPIKSVLIVDARANEAQRAALTAFAKQMGGDLFSEVVRVDAQPIDFTMAKASVHSRELCMKAGKEAEIATRPLENGDQICHNEEVWYPPLTKVDHAMAAYTVADGFQGNELGTVWSYPNKRASFVATFHLDE